MLQSAAFLESVTVCEYGVMVERISGAGQQDGRVRGVYGFN